MLYGRTELCEEREARRLLAEHDALGEELWAAREAELWLDETGTVLGLRQPLGEHLDHVSQGCAADCGRWGSEEVGRVLGLLHDLGKMSPDFQRRLVGERVRTDHATAGMLACGQLDGPRQDNLYYKLMAYAVAGHHSGLLDYGDALDKVASMARRAYCHQDEAAQVQKWLEELGEERLRLQEKGPAWRPMKSLEDLAVAMEFYTRFLFSTLVDNDRFDAQCFSWPQLSKSRHSGLSLETMRLQLEEHMRQLTAQKQDTPLGKIRQSIVEDCRQKAALEPGFFELNVPTGGGKTLASLTFALEHARGRDFDRVIYALPFTAIIEQNAQVYREIFGEPAVIESHCQFEAPEEKEEAELVKLFMENFDGPLVVTTNVTFFESIYTHKPSKARKLHHYAHSIIILDEAQAIPNDFVKPCLRALAELVDHYGCTVVFCTATQPDFAGNGLLPPERAVREIINDAPGLFKALKRTQGVYLGACDLEDIAGRLTEQEQCLCIVNTKRHAVDLFERLPQEEGTYHLSTLMYPEHRKAIIKAIKERLRLGLPCRVVSTQLLEAGVDLDFPVVYRSMSGIDSLVQAAGRCNREKRQPVAPVYVFVPEETYRGKGHLALTAQIGQQIAEEYADFLGLEAIQAYFAKLYHLTDHRLDAKAILQHDSQAVKAYHFAFKTIGCAFKMIEDDGHGVVIPATAEVENALRSLPFTDDPGKVLRKLGAYTVSLADFQLQELADGGHIRQEHGLWILNDLADYDAQKGLQIKGLSELDYFL